MNNKRKYVIKLKKDGKTVLEAEGLLAPMLEAAEPMRRKGFRIEIQRI